MPRLLGVEIPSDKRIEASLTYIYGIGLTTSKRILEQTNINPNTRAVFLTHVLGFNGLEDRLIEACKKNGVLLIEDMCESHGATHKGQKLGSLGFTAVSAAVNFSRNGW